VAGGSRSRSGLGLSNLDEWTRGEVLRLVDFGRKQLHIDG
jgi:hypothetical protein